MPSPRIRVIRVSNLPSSLPIILNPYTGLPYHRFGPFVDIGMVNIGDAAIYGRTRPLIPYADGRLIKSVRFVPGGTFTNPTGSWIIFATPNTCADYSRSQTFGIAGFHTNGDNVIDTLGIIPTGYNTGITGLGANPNNPSDFSQILDGGPLVAGVEPGYPFFLPTDRWVANAPYCQFDIILDSNGHFQQVIVNGVAASSEPTWDDSGGETTDGTATLTDLGLGPSGEIHVIAEVIEGVSPMPPYPASIEFIVPPQSFVAGETMPDVTVMVKDQNGDPYKFVPIAIDLMVYGANGGTLNSYSGALIDVVTGIATFSGLTTEDIGTFVMRANTHPVFMADPIFCDPFNVT